MRILPYYHLSQVVDFNRYIKTPSSSRHPLKALLLVIKGSYNIYLGKSTSCAKFINYTRYIKSTKKSRSTNLTRFFKNYLGEIEIVGAVVGVAVFVFFIN
mgnify:FL=1